MQIRIGLQNRAIKSVIKSSFWNGFQIQVQSTKKDCNMHFASLQSQSCRCLAIGGAFPDPGSKFDPFFGGSMVKFLRNRQFFSYTLVYFKNINRSDTKLSPACSPFLRKQNEVSLQFIDEIFVTHSIPEGNSVTLIGKIA